LGLAALPGPRQLGKASDPRLIVPCHDPMLLDLVSSPNSNWFRLWLNPRLLGPSFYRGSKLLSLVLQPDTIKELMSYPKCRSVEVIKNPARPGSNHREVNYIEL